MSEKESEGAILPETVAEHFGFKDKNGEFVNGALFTSLVDLNDEGKSFEEIANVIESNPKGMFV